jgi:putative oxidoreductase
MKRNLFSTEHDVAALIARTVAGLVLFPHGAQKILGWFGGYGFKGTMNFFTCTLHLPWLLGFLVIIIEFIGSLSLILGFASRIWAAGIVVVMIGIIFTSHIQNGFFLNWFGNQAGEGYEFDLLMIALALIPLIKGGGAFSLDRTIFLKMKNGD